MTSSNVNAKIRLNDPERRAIPTLKWLLDWNDNIGTGRSFAMAYVFLWRAIKYYPLQKTYTIFDHVVKEEGVRSVMKTIKELWEYLVRESGSETAKARFGVDRFSISSFSPADRRAFQRILKEIENYEEEKS